MVGSFGLASRRTHTVMGRTITIASRLVDLTVDLAHPILVGEGMAAQLGGQFSVGKRAGGGPAETQHLQSMGTFLLEGLRVPHHIYAVPLDTLVAGQMPSALQEEPPAKPTAHGTT